MTKDNALQQRHQEHCYKILGCMRSSRTFEAHLHFYQLLCAILHVLNFWCFLITSWNNQNVFIRLSEYLLLLLILVLLHCMCVGEWLGKKFIKGAQKVACNCLWLDTAVVSKYLPAFKSVRYPYTNSIYSLWHLAFGLNNFLAFHRRISNIVLIMTSFIESLAK